MLLPSFFHLLVMVNIGVLQLPGMMQFCHTRCCIVVALLHLFNRAGALTIPMPVFQSMQHRSFVAARNVAVHVLRWPNEILLLCNLCSHVPVSVLIFPFPCVTVCTSEDEHFKTIIPVHRIHDIFRHLSEDPKLWIREGRFSNRLVFHRCLRNAMLQWMLQMF